MVMLGGKEDVGLEVAKDNAEVVAADIFGVEIKVWQLAPQSLRVYM